jgi:serine/threonine protein kinase
MTQPTHQNALPLGSMLMEYRLVSVLGAGGFGITYLGHDTNLEKDVAIKEYLPSAFATRGPAGVVPTSLHAQHDYKWGLERFIQEARTLAKFSHPHIVRVNRFFEANGTGYMVMDYEAGVPLKTWLQKHSPASEALIKALMMPLLDGLEKVHAAGFLHRDIKPDNIFVRQDGGPVLIDFGAARHAMTGASQNMTTIVSPGYAPFEQYTTTSEQGPWTDIYSLCGVLYFAVTGNNPPDAITRMKADTVAQGLAAARARYSEPFIRAIEWGLSLEEAKRPRNVPELHEALFGRAAAPVSMPTTAKTQPLSRPIAPLATPAASHVRTERVDRTPPPVTIIAAPAREERGPSVWRWAVPALVAVAVVGMGFRSLGGRQSPTQAITVVTRSAPAQAARPASREDFATTAGSAQPEAVDASQATAAPVPVAETAPAAAPSASESITPARAPASAAPPIPSVVANRTPSGNVEQQALENALRGGGAGSIGMTREELAKTYPQMAARFDQIDTDHDGRVSPQELVDAIQGLGGDRKGPLE